MTASPSGGDRTARAELARRSGARPCFAIGIPAYYYPGPHWESTVTGAPTVRYVVVNPGDGPGRVVDPAYASTIDAVRAAGVGLLGYVPTAWGARPAEEVLRDVRTYRDWYGVTGVFLDEAATAPGLIGHYTHVTDAVRADAQDALVALNPGVPPDEGYAAICDLLVVFEGPRSSYVRWVPPEWLGDHPRDRFWHVVYGTSRRSMPAVLRQAARQRAGVVYVTDRVTANPWDGLPPYWAAEVAAVARMDEAIGGASVGGRPAGSRP